MPIDSSARKEAHAWFLGQPQTQPLDVSVCPSSLSYGEKITDLRTSKPEYYGRVARLIIASVDTSHKAREQRQPLGFVSWNNEPILPESIEDFRGFETAFYTTLAADMQQFIIDIRTFDYEDKQATLAFEEFLALRALLRQRTALKQYGFGDPTLDLQAGIGTATTHIAKLLPLMVDYLASQEIPTEAMPSIIKQSHKPIMRLAAMSGLDLVAFGEKHLPFNQDDTFLKLNDRGLLDFQDTVIEELEPDGTDFGPTVGCPVLFGHDTTKNLWQWGVDAAEKCGLLKPGLYQ